MSSPNRDPSASKAAAFRCWFERQPDRRRALREKIDRDVAPANVLGAIGLAILIFGIVGMAAWRLVTGHY